MTVLSVKSAPRCSSLAVQWLRLRSFTAKSPVLIPGAEAKIQQAKWSRSVVSDSFWPHGLYPTRLLHPWDFPGKSTGVGRHFLLQGILPTQGLNPDLPHCRQTLYRLSHQGSPKDVVKKKKCPQMEVKWKSLSCIQLFVTPWIIHGILPATLLEWVAFPFSRGSSQPRDQTKVSCIAGEFFTSWATWEALRCK